VAVVLTSQEALARKKVCLALDVPSLEDARELVRVLHPYVGMYKVGLELFTAEGPDVVRTIQDEGGDVFLDLKFHDIPNTVKGAARSATKLGVYMFNVHASGGVPMMRAAVQGVEEGLSKYDVRKPKVIGVTVLTSLDEARYLQTFQPMNPSLEGIDFRKYVGAKKDDELLQDEFRALLKRHHLTDIIQRQVFHLADLSYGSGFDGIVCSAADLYAVKKLLPMEFTYTTPGVKGPKSMAGADQARVFTPGNAIQDGSDFLVIGRDPYRTGNATPEEMQKSAYEILQDMAPHMEV
jgi:orotidine-5'-phosphate decarboxylase